MGSYDTAVMTGFICRLCSELNRNVVHIYSEKGKSLRLAEKINLIPISIEPQDDLPKTICRSCITQLDVQYKLVQQIRQAQKEYKKQREHGIVCPLHDTVEGGSCPLQNGESHHSTVTINETDSHSDYETEGSSDIHSESLSVDNRNYSIKGDN